ncbi:MAG TPA: helix-turn-helix transcriptional regulator [Sphingomicrobium sp.]
MKHFIDSHDPDRPVIGLEDEYDPGFTDLSHSHRRAQLLYAASGVMSVIVESASFVIPPQRALWVPGGIAHEVSCRGHVSLRTLYFDDSVHDLGQGHCRVIEVSDLLHALILEVAHFGSDYDMSGREGRIIRLLLEEIDLSPNAPYHAPMPRDRRLLRVCRAILEDPADQRDLDDWADVAGMGRRTFTRLFREETGMGLAVWRQQVRLMEALSLLASGRPITTVAFDVGYESPSAFTAMFHRAFGVPPSQYRVR